tara:strand:+ start:96 stop:617 length:522 start_codon:yes stop_codon:yes gene_type:complete
MLDDSIFIGYVAKVHGLDGSFSIKLNGQPKFCDLCLKISKIHIISPHINYSINNRIINSNIFLKVKLNELSNREEAKKLLKKEIYIKKGHVPEIDCLIIEQNKLIGYNVIYFNNSIGKIESIDYNRYQPIIIINNNNNRFMLPYVNNYIVNLNEELKEITVDFPEGLIEACGI